MKCSRWFLFRSGGVKWSLQTELIAARLCWADHLRSALSPEVLRCFQEPQCQELRRFTLDLTGLG